MRYWIGVASYDHVLNGVNGGLCQLGQGQKLTPEKMQPNVRFLEIAQPVPNRPLIAKLEFIF